jgi:hypothetical protein
MTFQVSIRVERVTFGVYRTLVVKDGDEVDCLIAVRSAAPRRWRACADVVVEEASFPLLAAGLRYACAVWASASRAATTSARGSDDDS